ncbi:protein kinase-like domain, concanavalin A-like lectin/glucanase domain protein [Tanacetum coccineum]
MRTNTLSTPGEGYQTKLEKALIDFDSHQEKRLSSLRTQLGQQQDDMISKINLLWKAISEKLDDAPIRDTAGNPAAQMNFTSTNDPTREELRGKGIKSPSKLLSPKYLSQSSLAEQNRNPSSPKRVHFVNSIVILNKEDEAKEEGNVKTSTTEYEDHEMTVESEEEFGEETKDEIEEEDEDSPKHFDTFPTMKGLRLHYNWIMSKRLGPRRKPSNPRKICNFMGRVKGLKVFVGNFTYECNFMVLEDTTSVIDHDLGSVIFGKPFIEATGLVYDMEEGTVTFEKDKENIMFKMPHKMEMFKHIDFTDIKTDRIPPFAIESDDDSSEKTHYSDNLDLGSEYKHDENVCRAIQSLIAIKAKRNKEKSRRTLAGDGVTGIKRRRRDLSSDDVRNLATASGGGRLKEDLESSTWRRQCPCTDEWSLDALLREHCLSSPYHTELPTPEDIRLSHRVYILPYGMLLTRLFRHVMAEYPDLHSDNYILDDRVMLSLGRHDNVNQGKTLVNLHTRDIARKAPLDSFSHALSDGMLGDFSRLHLGFE